MSRVKEAEDRCQAALRAWCEADKKLSVAKKAEAFARRRLANEDAMLRKAEKAEAKV